MKNEKTTNSNLTKQLNVGAGPVSAQKGITLIALIITVIVLLILAGVTINLTLGNNGIFKTAEQAAKNYTDAQNKELADLNEFQNIVDKVAQSPEYNPSLLKLKPGDYVKYDTGVSTVGDNGVATFRVLYDATSKYGLQIISDKNIAKVTLGGSDWETGKASYNKAIETLNTEAMKYKNNTYATDARCVGSNPLNKNTETTNTVTLPNNYAKPVGWESKDTGCYDMDENYITDKTAMDVAGISTAGAYYWLASRNVISNESYCDFNVRFMRGDGSLFSDYLCVVNLNGNTNYNSYNFGIRPCITLKRNVNVTSGDGASETTAYTLGI